MLIKCVGIGHLKENSPNNKILCFAHVLLDMYSTRASVISSLYAFVTFCGIPFITVFMSQNSSKNIKRNS